MDRKTVLALICSPTSLPFSSWLQNSHRSLHWLTQETSPRVYWQPGAVLGAGDIAADQADNNPWSWCPSTRKGKIWPAGQIQSSAFLFVPKAKNGSHISKWLEKNQKKNLWLLKINMKFKPQCLQIKLHWNCHTPCTGHQNKQTKQSHLFIYTLMMAL